MKARLVARFAGAGALQVMLLRGLIVASNFVVMLALAASLGLDAFGRLAVFWGMALVASTLIGCGAPLSLLRSLSDGRGMRPGAVIMQVIVLPLLLAVVGVATFSFVWPGWPAAAILGAGFSVHLLTSLASIMRALGSVQVSMLMRDAAPQMVLGLAAFLAGGTDVVAILWAFVLLTGFGALLVAFWCWRHADWPRIVSPTHSASTPDPALWGTAILGMVLSQVDIVFGGSLLPSEEAGLYALLRRITNLVALPVSVATWVSATKVSSAFGKGNFQALRSACAEANRIAIWPAAALAMGALALLPLLQASNGPGWPVYAGLAFFILILGALGQAFFAAGYTVATLCGLAHVAALSRLLAVFGYLVAISVAGPTMAGNAALYVVAVTGASLLVWAVIRRRLDLDTSALNLLDPRGRRWTTP